MAAYATSAELKQSLTKNASKVNESIDSLSAGGSTNTSRGIDTPPPIIPDIGTPLPNHRWPEWVPDSHNYDEGNIYMKIPVIVSMQGENVFNNQELEDDLPNAYEIDIVEGPRDVNLISVTGGDLRRGTQQVDLVVEIPFRAQADRTFNTWSELGKLKLRVFMPEDSVFYRSDVDQSFGAVHETDRRYMYDVTTIGRLNRALQDATDQLSTAQQVTGFVPALVAGIEATVVSGSVTVGAFILSAETLAPGAQEALEAEWTTGTSMFLEKERYQKYIQGEQSGELVVVSGPIIIRNN